MWFIQRFNQKGKQNDRQAQSCSGIFMQINRTADMDQTRTKRFERIGEINFSIVLSNIKLNDEKKSL